MNPSLPGVFTGLLLSLTGTLTVLGVGYRKHRLLLPHIGLSLLWQFASAVLVGAFVTRLFLHVGLMPSLAVLLFTLPFVMLDSYFLDVVMSHYVEIRDGNHLGRPLGEEGVLFAYNELAEDV